MVIHDSRLEVLQAAWQTGVTGPGRKVVVASPGAAGKGLLLWTRKEDGTNFLPLGIHSGGIVPLAPRGTVSDVKIGFSYRPGKVAPSSARGLDPLSREHELRTHQPTGEIGVAWPRKTQITVDGDLLVVTVGATTTHTIYFNRSAGGAVQRWRVEKPSSSIDSLFVNNGGGWTRGIQAGLEWVDDTTGELTKHNPVQGGSRFATSANDPQEFHGSPLVGDGPDGGTIIKFVYQPLEFDPDGFYTIPGVHTDHGGGLVNPVLWRDIRMETELWINFRGTENLHRIRTNVTFPYDVDTCFFDTGFYHMMCVRPDQFTRVLAFDSQSDTETVLSSGAVGNPNYQVELRRYMMNRVDIAGDDEAIPSGASSIPSGDGGIIAAGAGAGDFAVAMAGNLDLDFRAVKTLNNWPAGNAWQWLQKRDGSSGETGSNVIMLSHGAHSSGKIHDHTSLRKIISGQLVLDSFIATDTLTQVESILDDIKLLPHPAPLSPEET